MNNRILFTIALLLSLSSLSRDVHAGWPQWIVHAADFCTQHLTSTNHEVKKFTRQVKHLDGTKIRTHGYRAPRFSLPVTFQTEDDKSHRLTFSFPEIEFVSPFQKLITEKRYVEYQKSVKRALTEIFGQEELTFIGSGGYASVYGITGFPDYVIKVFFPDESNQMDSDVGELIAHELSVQMAKAQFLKSVYPPEIEVVPIVSNMEELPTALQAVLKKWGLDTTLLRTYYGAVLQKKVVGGSLQDAITEDLLKQQVKSIDSHEKFERLPLSPEIKNLFATLKRVNLILKQAFVHSPYDKNKGLIATRAITEIVYRYLYTEFSPHSMTWEPVFSDNFLDVGGALSNIRVLEKDGKRTFIQFDF